MPPTEMDYKEARKEDKIYCKKGLDACPFPLCCHFCPHYHIDCTDYCFKEYWNICPERCKKDEALWKKVFKVWDDYDGEGSSCLG